MVNSTLSHISYLLDTNIISELIKPQPNQHVISQFQLYQHEIAIPSLVWNELRFGWLKMPQGQRKEMIGSFLHDIVSLIPILSYHESAAKIHAEIRLEAQQNGLNIPFADGQIAAIAMAQGLALITRNSKDFQNISGLRLVNWFR